MRVIPATDIRLDHCEVYLPQQRMSVQECMVTERNRRPMTVLPAHWKDTLIEPDHLVRFMNGQTASARGQTAPVVPGGLLESTALDAACQVYCADSETSSDMAVRVCSQMAEKHPRVLCDAGVLLHAQSTMNEIPTSSIPCRLQHELKMSHAIPFGISQKAGNSLLAAIGIASSMLAAEAPLNSAILCASEKFVEPYSRLLPGGVLVHDSAACMVLRKGGSGLKLLAMDLRDFPALWTSRGYPGGDEAEGMRQVVRNTKTITTALLDELGISPSQVSLVVPLNLSSSTAELIIKECGFAAGALYGGALSQCGSFANTELMIKLDSIQSEYTLLQDSIIVVVSFGYGISIGCTVLTVC